LKEEFDADRGALVAVLVVLAVPDEFCHERETEEQNILQQDAGGSSRAGVPAPHLPPDRTTPYGLFGGGLDGLGYVKSGLMGG